MQFIKNRFFTGHRPESGPAPYQGQPERTTASFPGAEASNSSNFGSGPDAATGSNTFSSQSGLARNDDVSTSSPIGSKMRAAVESEQIFTVVESAPDGSNTEARGSSGSRDELDGNFYHE